VRRFFYEERDEAHRLFEVDVTTSPPYEPLCAFLEVWGHCPKERLPQMNAFKAAFGHTSGGGNIGAGVGKKTNATTRAKQGAWQARRLGVVCWVVGVVWCLGASIRRWW